MTRAVLAAALLLSSACAPGTLDHVDPPVAELPCDENNPYRCTDVPGIVCCYSYAPVCWGPDATGYYCEEQQPDPDDPTHLFGKRRLRARHGGT